MIFDDEDFKEPAGLEPEDYMEPRCLTCGDKFGPGESARPIDAQRVIRKMDEYMSRKDYEGAERHLLYWLEDAVWGNDFRGQLLIRNELIGHYRKMGRRDEALENVQEALKLIRSMGFDGTISSGTTYVNAATACHAFGQIREAAELFEKARKVYEETPGTPAQLLGGLYNNMALTLVEMQRYDEALELFEKALGEMKQTPGGELEQAITWLNMADALRGKLGDLEAEKICEEYLDTAWDLLDNFNGPRDGYYAFVCEKCAPVFSYYGYFMAADELEKRAGKIYAEQRKAEEG